MNSPNQHIPVNNIDPGKNVGDGEGSVQVHLEEDLMQVNAKVFARSMAKAASARAPPHPICLWRFPSWGSVSFKSVVIRNTTPPSP